MYPSSILSVIKEFDIKCDKKRGQCILIDNNLLEAICRDANLTFDDIVIEIGSGPANLTSKLLKYAYKVIAYETDREMFKVYDKYFNENKNVIFLMQDFLKADIKNDIKTLIGDEINNKKIKIVANIPYYITSPILEKILYLSDINFYEIYLLIQYDVAKRLVSKPSSKDYGILTIACSLKADVDIIRHVPKSCFYPKPDVHSAIVKLKLNNMFAKNEIDEKIFFAILKSAFNQRRKYAINSIVKNINWISKINKCDEKFIYFLENIDLKNLFSEIFEKLSIDNKSRAEDISCEQYIQIFKNVNLKYLKSNFTH